MAEHSFQVVKISTEQTYALRTAVLRADTPSKDPKYAEDSKQGTVHFGIFDENKNLIATSTWVINPWQEDHSAIAVQLRGMAVATKHQKSGLGKLLLEAGFNHAKTHNAKYVYSVFIVQSFYLALQHHTFVVSFYTLKAHKRDCSYLLHIH